MSSEVHRDSLSAWRGLCEIGALELQDRDRDLTELLKNQIDPNAQDLDTALANTSTDLFLQAFFQIIQPFSLMFRDVLEFFETAGARQGQTQWRISVGDEFVDLRHFEEFLEHWNNIECEIEVPAIDLYSAFIPNNVRIELGGLDYLREDEFEGCSQKTGIEDVDSWLSEYDEGRYAPFPQSLRPENLEHGMDEAAQIVLAALSIIGRRGLNREEMLCEHRERSYKCDRRDGLHPWSIAQNETDYWLRSCVQYLGILLTKSAVERKAFGEKLASAYARFPRRQMNADIQIMDLERLLSLPAWNKRYETYGVWVATEIVRALEDHEVIINHRNGELKFGFAEARIADVKSARPKVSLFAERRTEFSESVSPKRFNSVQPDYGLWAPGRHPDQCIMIVEVKHYKRRSRRNFRDALIDYGNAHQKAKVVLVNYGSVGSEFTDLPVQVQDRCRMMGYLTPENKSVRDEFRDVIRGCVGEPVKRIPNVALFSSGELAVLDVSMSMSSILDSDWFADFMDDLAATTLDIALVDNQIREIGKNNDILDWLSSNTLGNSTSLLGPISDLLRNHETLIVLTDYDGLNSLGDLAAMISELDMGNETNVKLLKISRPSIQ